MLNFSQKRMILLFFYLVFFHLQFLTVQQYVSSAAVLSHHDLRVQELMENGKLTDDCKDMVRGQILSKSSREWCTMFDLYKDFIVGSSDCDGAEYDALKLAACAKERPAVVTTWTINTTVRTPNPALVIHPSFTPTGATTNVSAKPTSVTNIIKNIQVRATHRPCVFCGSSRNSSVGLLFVIVLVYLVSLIS